MKKEALRGWFICSGIWGVLSVLVASSAGCMSGLGNGLGQNSQAPIFPDNQTVQHRQTPPFGTPPQTTNEPPIQPMYRNEMQPNQPAPPAQGGFALNNNTMLPNQGHATFNTATQEVHIPFEMDTSRLMAFSVVVDENVQTLTVVDPVEKSVAVYNIYLGKGPNAGKIEWMSGRNIFADLKYDEYNPMKPFPKEVRAVLEQSEKTKKSQ